ncbi:MAG: hypothetical protein HYS04_15070 [Acidobacteria bacterium]|nr:hypothetical protein [Acidobacteriota bacterium]
MFERYTEDARKSIFFARSEASRFGSSRITADHLFLGIARSGPQSIERLVGSRETAGDLRKAIETGIPDSSAASSAVDLPLDPACRQVLQAAAREWETRRHARIENEHLLMGLWLVEQTEVSKKLRALGISEEQAEIRLFANLEDLAPSTGFRIAEHEGYVSAACTACKITAVFTYMGTQYGQPVIRLRCPTCNHSQLWRLEGSCKDFPPEPASESPEE